MTTICGDGFLEFSIDLSGMYPDVYESQPIGHLAFQKASELTISFRPHSNPRDESFSIRAKVIPEVVDGQVYLWREHRRQRALPPAPPSEHALLLAWLGGDLAAGMALSDLLEESGNAEEANELRRVIEHSSVNVDIVREEWKRCAEIADAVADRWDEPYNESPAAEVARRIRGLGMR